MPKQQILKQAIEKAVKSGYSPIKLKENELISEIKCNDNSVIIYKRKRYSRKKDGLKLGKLFFFQEIIFSHDFAKAFFGEEVIRAWDSSNPKDYGIIAWQYHLRQMVLEKDPILYLKKFLT